MTLWPSKQLQNIDATTNNYKIYHIKKINIINNSYIQNYGLRHIAAFCSARKDLKTLCLKLASEPSFLILAFMQFQSFIVLIVKVRPPSDFRLYLGHIRFTFECLVA